MAIADEVRLRVYNDALRHLGARALASVSETRETRRDLDAAWNSGALVRYCLEQGSWNFALRTVEADYSPSVEPGFGFRRAFDKPDDFVRLEGLSGDPSFTLPLNNRQYVDEAGFWFCDLDVIYIRYVSDDDGYGMDGGLWTETFTRYVAAELASECSDKITADENKVRRLEVTLRRMRIDARSKDAMNEGIKYPPTGGWVRSRQSMRDRERG